MERPRLYCFNIPHFPHLLFVILSLSLYVSPPTSLLQVSRHERRISQIEQLNQMPLYPTEKIIWDENIVPTEYYSGEGVCGNVHALEMRVFLLVCAQKPAVLLA
jgi:hypothetical protein